MENKIKLSEDWALSIVKVLQEALGQNQAQAPIETPTKWEDIKTFEHACAVCAPSEDEQYILNHPGQSKAAKASIAHTKLSIVSRAMNSLNNGEEMWVPDWSNSNQYKYYPWLKYAAGSGFSDYDYGYVIADTGVGSRLCFMTSDMARHAAVQFEELYNDLFTL